MRQQLTVRGSLRDEQVRSWLEEPIGRLARRAAASSSLHVLLRQEPGGRAEATLTLKVPGRTLSASGADPDARSALTEAFAELERLVAREGARLARASAGREATEAFQRGLLRRFEGQASEPSSASGEDTLPEQLEELERFVRRELGWREASGELTAGEIDPRDVVDAAFAEAFARCGGRPSRYELLRGAMSALRAELRVARETRQEIHIEEKAAEVPAAGQAANLGSEIFDFYQPDASLRVEDLVRGLARTPEEIETSAELAEVVETTLAMLPPRWRHAYQLRHVEGLDDASVARALGVRPEQVTDLAEHARAFLRDRLVEFGLLDADLPTGPAANCDRNENEAAVRAHRQELSERTRQRHDMLTAALERLESALAAPAALRPRPWSERVEAELVRVREAIDRHIEGVEESTGLFDEVVVAEPRLFRRVAELKREHTVLRTRAGGLAGLLQGNADTDFRALRQRAAGLLAALRAHRAAEADLVYEAFWTDIGSVD